MRQIRTLRLIVSVIYDHNCLFSSSTQIISLERARKIEELERKLNDLELLRIKYNRKVNLLKDQLKVNREGATQERDLNDHAFQKLSSELNATRKNLMECTRREGQVIRFRTKKHVTYYITSNLKKHCNWIWNSSFFAH